MRKPTINSVAGSLQIARTIQTQIQPPDRSNLNERELEIFNSLIQSREQSTWTPYDLLQAVALSRVWFQYEQALINEDYLWEKYLKIATELSKQLGLAASSRGLGSAKQGQRNLAEQDIRHALNLVGGTDNEMLALIA